MCGGARCVFASRKPLAGGCPRTPLRPSCAMSMSAEAPEQDHLMAHTGPRGHRQAFSRRGRRLHPVSVARSCTVRMSSSPAGSPQPGVLSLRGLSSCVTGGPTGSDSAERPPQLRSEERIQPSSVPGRVGVRNPTFALQPAGRRSPSPPPPPACHARQNSACRARTRPTSRPWRSSCPRRRRR